MPERDETLSGYLPGEKKPTIIGEGENRMKKPTVIGGSAPATPSPSAVTIKPTNIATALPVENTAQQRKSTVTTITPTTIVTALPAENAAQQRNPSVITSTMPTPVSEPVVEKVKLQPTAITVQNLPPTKSIVIDKPSAMTGVVRKGIEITKNELSMYFPGTPDAVLDRALEILKVTVVEILDERKCVQWGMAEQEKYGQLIAEVLTISTSKVVQESSRHIGRLQTLLSEIAQAFQDQGAGGFTFWKKRETPLEKFQANEPEINQLSQILRQALSDVVDIQVKMEKTAEEFQTLLLSLDAEAISASYISDMLSGKTDKQQALSQRLLDRALSLQQTVANIQQGAITRQSTNREIGKLVSKIQNVILVQLPAWMEQLGNSQSLKLTETDLYTFREGLNEVVRQLS